MKNKKRRQELTEFYSKKVVVITGAGSGIGRCLALQLDTLGAKLAISDVNPDSLEQLYKDTGCRHMKFQLDVADRDAVYQFAKEVETTLGPAQIVLNNAGVAVSQSVGDIDYADFEWLMNINFWGMVYGTQAFLPQLKQHEQANIANVSSLFGLLSIPTQAAYNASKFAIRGFTESLQAELAGSGIVAHSIHPGGIKTDIARNARIYVAPGGVADAKAGHELFDRISFTTPERAANIILTGISAQKPRILVGPDAVALDLMQRLLPQSYVKGVVGFSNFLSRPNFISRRAQASA